MRACGILRVVPVPSLSACICMQGVQAPPPGSAGTGGEGYQPATKVSHA